MHVGLSKASVIVLSDAVRRMAQTRCCPSSEEDHTSSDCDGHTGVVKESLI